MDKEIRKIQFRRIWHITELILLIVLISAIAFTYFRISTEGHRAFREAKNIKLAFQLLSVEYYGDKKSVYDPNKLNGMTEGVQERIAQLLENDGAVMITSYRKRDRKVTGFIYTIGRYRVTYRYNEEEEDDYTIDYVIPILHYDGKA